MAKPTKKSNPVMELVLAQLRSNPKASYAEVADAVKTKGHKIYPIVYGRAKALLGLVKSRPRGTGRTAAASRPSEIRVAAAARAATTANRGPRGAKRGLGGEPTLANLEDFIKSFEQVRRERDSLREALETAQRALTKALR